MYYTYTYVLYIHLICLFAYLSSLSARRLRARALLLSAGPPPTAPCFLLGLKIDGSHIAPAASDNLYLSISLSLYIYIYMYIYIYIYIYIRKYFIQARISA